jgi:hypothetical protein
MKRIMIIALMSTMFGMGVYADSVNDSIPTQENITSDIKLFVGDSLVTLPREVGTLQRHQNKVSKWAKITGKVAGVAGSLGALGTVVGAHAGSISGARAGLTALSSATTVSTIADATDAFAGMEGYDIVLTPAQSTVAIKADGKDVRILYTTVYQKTPDETVRIIKFAKDKKERRFQWFNYSYPLLTSKKAEKSGYIVFKWQKTGENTYIITIPAEVVKPGEYAIVSGETVSISAIPAPTFRIEK